MNNASPWDTIAPREPSNVPGCLRWGWSVGLSGCLDVVVSQVARTEAVPATLQFGGGEDCDDGDVCVRPHLVRALDEEIDSGTPALGTLQVRGWLAGTQLRAQDYNSSRRNKPTTRSADGDSEVIARGAAHEAATMFNTLRCEVDN